MIPRILGHACLGVLLMLPTAGRPATVTEMKVGDVSFAVCEIDLRNDRLAMYWKSDRDEIYGSLRALDAVLRKQGKKVVCGTNDGIFDETQKLLDATSQRVEILPGHRARGNDGWQPWLASKRHLRRQEDQGRTQYRGRSRRRRQHVWNREDEHQRARCTIPRAASKSPTEIRSRLKSLERIRRTTERGSSSEECVR